MTIGGIDLSIVIVHGSVETSVAQPYISGLIQSAKSAMAILKQNGGHLTAVEKALNILEDNPLFNAGLGSVLNREGMVEVDGSIMDGETGKFGAVASMSGIRYAISIARKVLEETEHVLLAGNGATTFAQSKGYLYENCIIPEQLNSWNLAKEMVKRGEPLVFSDYTGLQKQTDTVGCVLLDEEGRLAAGSSTGGSFFKLPGRVGDTPFIGGGIFASMNSATVCTGKGEAFIQTLTAKFVDDQIAEGNCPEDVARAAISRLYQMTNETGGIIVIDRKGRFAAAHNCDKFPVAIAIGDTIKQLDPIDLNYT